MSDILLASVNFAAWGLIQWAIAVIVIGGVVGIVVVALRAMNITIPPPIKMILWIVAIVIVAVVAVKILASML